MNNEELLSKTIRTLRFPLAVGIVFIHFNLSGGLRVRGVEYGLNNPEWYYWIISFFSDVIPRIGVPLFFLMSGFLFFYKTDFNNIIYVQKLKKRAKTLFVPYVLWNTIAILFKLCCYKLPLLSVFFPNAYKVDVCVTPVRLFKTFFCNFPNEGIFVERIITPPRQNISQWPYPIDFPLWFVRDLIVMVILSPIIFWCVIKVGRWFVITLGIIWFFYEALFMPDGGWSVLLSRAAFFFSWGAYYSINKINFVVNMRKYKFFPLLYVPISILDTIQKGSIYSIYIHEIGVLVWIVSAIIIVSCFLEKGIIKESNSLANSSFFIIALHGLIILDMGRSFFLILNLSDNTYNILFVYFIVPVVTITMCYFLYIVSRRYIPQITYFFTGGR